MLLVERLQALDGRGAGDLAAFVAAHSVRDDEEPEIGADQERVLVVLPATDVAASGGAHQQGCRGHDAGTEPAGEERDWEHRLVLHREDSLLRNIRKSSNLLNNRLTHFVVFNGEALRFKLKFLLCCNNPISRVNNLLCKLNFFPSNLLLFL